MVPLSTQAIAIVRELLDAQARRPAQRYLLPNRDDLKKPISENTLNGALRCMGYEEQLTGHGIRGTISTALNELGYRVEWIDAQLSHADPNQIRAAYNQPCGLRGATAPDDAGLGQSPGSLEGGRAG